jgi:hypothetical protein
MRKPGKRTICGKTKIYETVVVECETAVVQMDWK